MTINKEDRSLNSLFRSHSFFFLLLYLQLFNQKLRHHSFSSEFWKVLTYCLVCNPIYSIYNISWFLVEKLSTRAISFPFSIRRRWRVPGGTGRTRNNETLLHTLVCINYVLKDLIKFNEHHTINFSYIWFSWSNFHSFKSRQLIFKISFILRLPVYLLLVYVQCL